jgi:D-sedoheptulose 7-phosphate isomerase
MMGHFEETTAALQALDQSELDALRAAILACPGTIYVCGNGGSASTAEHWACDLTKAAHRRCVALGTNAAILTAYANDVSYSSALAAEFMRVAQPDDMLICLSCSGTSPNVRAVLAVAKQQGIRRALVTGRDGDAPLVVRVASDDYAVIEDVHLAIGHWLTKELG